MWPNRTLNEGIHAIMYHGCLATKFKASCLAKSIFRMLKLRLKTRGVNIFVTNPITLMDNYYSLHYLPYMQTVVIILILYLGVLFYVLFLFVLFAHYLCSY